MLHPHSMAQIVFISFAVILITGCLADCGENEEVTSCNGENEEVTSCNGDCTLRICPKHENYDASCTAVGRCAPSVCDCRFNYKRAENGTCIPARDCPKFNCDRQNEEFDPCPPLCPTDDCSQATVDGRCPLFGRIGIVVECTPKCRCIKGYWRKNGVCVQYSECPQFRGARGLL